jgi:hypothetical protein
MAVSGSMDGLLGPTFNFSLSQYTLQHLAYCADWNFVRKFDFPHLLIWDDLSVDMIHKLS